MTDGWRQRWTGPPVKRSHRHGFLKVYFCLKMNLASIAKDTRKTSIIATFIIFLALIRCISEPFRLQYYTAGSLTFADIKPFLLGALVTSLALLIMTILALFRKYKIINVACVLTVAALFIIKGIYMH
jgi:prolipoprotein diacylglyceryltransferase